MNSAQEILQTISEQEVNILGMKVSQDLIVKWVLDRGTDVLAAVMILVVGWFLSRLMRRVIRKLSLRAHIDQILANFLSNISYAFLLAFVVIAALGKLGVQTTSLVAVLGAAGLAIGLSLQKSLSNFAAGIMIIVFRYFKMGDVIRGGGSEGNVIDMNIFTTTLLTPRNEKVIVPNAMLTEGVLTNFTANHERRIEHVIGVGYRDDMDKVRAAITKVLKADPRILLTPEPSIEIVALAESSVNFEVQCWVKKEHFVGVKQQFLGEIKREFDAQGISFPYPQRDLHLVDAAALTIKKPAA